MTDRAARPSDAPWDQLEPLEDDAILVHIGTHKTGTTALQADLQVLRPRLAAEGVTYPSTTDAPHHAAQALIGGQFGWHANQSLFADDEPRRSPEERRKIWRRYARQVSSHPGRVLISTEYLCQANDAQATRLVRTLGPERVHIIVAFRPLQSLLPSSWQQYLKGGKATPYDDWLAAVLADPPDRRVTPTFWKRNDIPAQVGRWVSLLGADRVTTVIIDSLVDIKVRRAMEVLLALPPETIAETVTDGASNRSLTLAETEFLRGINEATHGTLSTRDYLDLVRFGAVRTMVESRTPEPEEPRLGLPEWAVTRVHEIGGAHAAWLKQSGVTVLGDPQVLEQAEARQPAGPGDTLPTVAAELALLGAVRAAAQRDTPVMQPTVSAESVGGGQTRSARWSTDSARLRARAERVVRRVRRPRT